MAISQIKGTLSTTSVPLAAGSGTPPRACAAVMRRREFARKLTVDYLLHLVRVTVVCVASIWSDMYSATAAACV